MNVEVVEYLDFGSYFVYVVVDVYIEYCVWFDLFFLYCFGGEM